MRKKTVKMTLAGIILSIGLLSIYHFKRDIFVEPLECYLLEANIESKSKYKLLLVSNAPYLKTNIKKGLERSFWKEISLDTLCFYDDFLVVYYRETKYLTRHFKEGNQYVPLYSHWDNTMDWRNHNEDRLGAIRLCKRKDGTGFYSIIINDIGYGVHMFVDLIKRNRTYQDFDDIKDFNDIKDFYIKKCKELGLEKTDIENDEEY
ncbi:MAG: hypothetical protein SOY99_01660 [Alloprevotella sp.]|nr:hypothetical protein [Alloprevotella sp.]